jgi:hypothetical protein
MTTLLTLASMIVVLLVTMFLILVTHSAWAYLIATVVSLSISAISLFIDPSCNIAVLFGFPLVTGLGAVALVRRDKWRYKLPDPER